MSIKFTTLVIETIKQEGKIEAIISNIKIPEKIADIGKLPVSRLGVPIIGNYETEVIVVLDDGTVTSIGIKGIAYLNKKVMELVNQDARNTYEAVEKFKDAIEVLKALRLDDRTVKEILNKI